MVYSLPRKRTPELEANLKCLQACVRSEREFARDLKKLAVIQRNCCEPSTAFHKSKRDRRRYGSAKHLASVPA
jgi:hypothetical protein